MERHRFWTRWLEVVGGILVAFGVSFAVLNQTPFFDLIFNRSIDPVFWPAGEVPAAAGRFQAWIYGVLGATIAGWGVLVFFIAKHPLAQGERWAWRGLAGGFTLWFVVDTALSAFFGVTFNVVFNCLLAAAIVLPLWGLRKDVLPPSRSRPLGGSS